MKKLILLSGWKGSGKDYVADILYREFGYKKFSFATELKNQVSNLYGISRDLLDTQSGKNAIYIRNITNRQVLINYGEEKRRQDPFFWVRKIYKNIENNQLSVVSDWRFKSEYTFLRQNLPTHEIITARICRYDINESPNDPTETNLDNFKFDYMILNYIKDDKENVANQLKRILGS